MSLSAPGKHPPHFWFNLFKYAIYGLLVVNIFLFFRDDWLAAEHLFAADFSLARLVEAFATTLDTTAWVLLLLLFELETYIIPDEKIKGKLKLSLHGIRALCFCAILYAFYGYVARCLALYDLTPLSVVDLCAMLDTPFYYMTGHDEYSLVDNANCHSLNASAAPLFMLESNVVTDQLALQAAQLLSWTDVVNAGDWLLVVLVLEMDVRLQLRGLLKGNILLVSKVIKSLLYSILLFAAIYWWIEGDFIDFWDAVLWIVAFIFIEMNVFEWQEETSHASKAERGKAW